MRLIGPRLPILAMIVLASGFVTGRADEVLYLETSDWIPTTSVLSLPTAYVVPSSYVVPTSYVFPTTYATAYVAETALLAPTTYVAPTYYETRLRRRGLFGRRLVETTRAYYIPTTAYYPTTYYYPTQFSSARIVDTAVVPSEYVVTSRVAGCCDTQVVAMAAAPAVRSYPSEQAPPPPAAPREKARSRPTRIESEPAEEPISSDVPQLPIRESDSRPALGSESDERSAESPPPPPAAIREQSSAARPNAAGSQTKAAPSPAAAQGAGGTGADKTGPASKASGTTGSGTQGSGTPGSATPRNPTPPSRSGSGAVDLPVAPADDLEPYPGGGSNTGGAGPVRRDSQKPVLATPRTLRSDLRNVLFGRVKARDTNEPEEGVRITLMNRNGAVSNKVALSDAFGRFAVKVPDGDWTVNVTMPSGRVYAVSEITVSNGLITDTIGRDIPSLVITR